MTAPSHLCFGLLNGLVLASLTTVIGEQPFGWTTETALDVIALALGALAPDLDSPHSLLSRLLPPARLIHRRWGHRTLLHSLLGLLLATTALYLLEQILGLLLPLPAGANVVLFFATGYGSHLLADCLTVRGVPLLFPLRVSFAYPSVERYRLRTGERKHELAFSGVSLIAAVAYLPVLQRGGAEASVHHTLANISTTYDDYRALVGQEAVLAFAGYYTASKEPVEGRAVILEATPKQFLTLFAGTVATIGEDNGLIIATSARCLPAGVPISITTLSISGDEWRGILPRLPVGVLVSGELTADHPFTLSDHAFNSITASGQALKLAFAQPSELVTLHPATRTNSVELAAEISALEADVHQVEQALSSSVATRRRHADPYERDRLFEQITELRQRKSYLDNQLERTRRNFQATQGVRLRFSGTLALRTLFVD